MTKPILHQIDILNLQRLVVLLVVRARVSYARRMLNRLLAGLSRRTILYVLPPHLAVLLELHLLRHEGSLG